MQYRQAKHNSVTDEQIKDFVHTEFKDYNPSRIHLHRDNDQHEIYVIMTNSRNVSFICVILLSIKGGEIYWKEMTENEGPCYYNCPEEFFKRAPLSEDSGYAKSWRNSCSNRSVKLNIL